MKSFHGRVRVSASLAQHVLIVTIAIAGLGSAALGQETQNSTTPAPAASPQTAKTETTSIVVKPVVTELRGVSLGMTTSDVKEKLGKPLSEDDTSMFYSFSDTESAQIGLGPNGKVRTIALIYSKGDTDAPKFQDIFGPEAQVAAADDGRVYKMVRYPTAGFWIAYSKIGEDKNALTTVTMKKIGDN
jgi:hypothetical protein